MLFLPDRTSDPMAQAPTAPSGETYGEWNGVIQAPYVSVGGRERAVAGGSGRWRGMGGRRIGHFACVTNL